ncbi:hypothetical protein DICPUDRAFT_146526 [Dictyostelium purpureum]|uniref:Importin subunit alpha n=1 Tax=Dictyostelium purpureum TaxID=5786 RepID=F0Z672_DICPU|nr:uncharacterized protein DICPUDRAFT_146526 [Dictyostelium purpureum]EGC40607.1 hypothetical protein DICPUDRAFT_146526 [Dictyostelium purpureum]|eukprot:XP_003282943.1 hypothetical protein DICPUDRAFT_146526 [Dictyostelium purpureum]
MMKENKNKKIKLDHNNNNNNNTKKNKYKDIDYFIKKTKSDDRDKILIGLEALFDIIVLTDECDPIKNIILSGLVPKFIEFLYLKDKKIQFETCRILNKIVLSGQSCLESDTVHALVSLLDSGDPDLFNKATKCLTSISKNKISQDLVLDSGATTKVLQLFSIDQENHRLSFIKNISCLFFSICRYHIPSFKTIEDFFPFIHYVFLNVTDEMIYLNVCKVLSRAISEFPEETVSMFFKYDLFGKIIELLYYKDNLEIQNWSLNVVGSLICTEGVGFIKILSFRGLLPHLLRLLSSEKKKTSAWIIRNIAIEPCTQQLLFDHGIVEKLISMLDSEKKLLNDILYPIYYCLRDPDIVNQMVELGIVKLLCSLLSTLFYDNDRDILVLKALLLILNVNDLSSNNTSIVLEVFMEAQFLHHLNNFVGKNQNHLTSKEISKVEKLICYFDVYSNEISQLYHLKEHYYNKWDLI